MSGAQSELRDIESAALRLSLRLVVVRAGTAAYSETGRYAARIVRGANPSELPVLQPTTFALAINMPAAEALRLDIPASVRLRADEVID